LILPERKRFFDSINLVESIIILKAFHIIHYARLLYFRIYFVRKKLNGNNIKNCNTGIIDISKPGMRGANLV
jgi:hypothetical protein